MRLLIALLCLTSIIFAEERPLKIQAFSRFFYDDNIFSKTPGLETDSGYISNTISIEGKALSDRISYKFAPELRYRLVDKKIMGFGNGLLKFDGEFTPVLLFGLKNMYTVAEKEPTALDDTVDMHFHQNTAQINIDWRPAYLTTLKLLYDSKVKRWSEDALLMPTYYTRGDFDQNTFGFQFERIHNRRYISALTTRKSFLDYNGNRGGFDYGSFDYKFTYVPGPFFLFSVGFGHTRGTATSQEGVTHSFSVPTYLAEATYFTARGTTIGLKMIYDVTDSSVAYWNVKENFKLSLMAKYPVTPKLNISAMVMNIKSTYQVNFNRFDDYDLYREEDVYVSSLIIDYNFNANHYWELGYQGLHLFNVDADLYRNKYFLGYKIRF